MIGDVITINGEHPSEPLLFPVMRRGLRLHAPESLEVIRARASAALARLPPGLRALDEPAEYPVHVSPTLMSLARDVDQRA